MESSSIESRILLAIEAIKQRENFSIRAATKVYNVPYSTLRNRMKGRHARQDTRVKSLRLTELEENIILQYILDLDTRGFPPRPCRRGRYG